MRGFTASETAGVRALPVSCPACSYRLVDSYPGTGRFQSATSAASVLTVT
jgi:hypothetical protein